MYHNIIEWVKLMHLTRIDIDRDPSLQDTANQAEDGTPITIIEAEVDTTTNRDRIILEVRNMRLPCISTNARYAQNLIRKVRHVRQSEPSHLAQTRGSFGGR
jgi:heptaprenylglyceryl phosphate synthase